MCIRYSIPYLAELICPINAGRLIQFGIDTRYRCQIYDGSPAKSLPDLRNHIDPAKIVFISDQTACMSGNTIYNLCDESITVGKYQDQTGDDYRRNKMRQDVYKRQSSVSVK